MDLKNYSTSYIRVLENTYSNICLNDIYDRLLTLRTLKELSNSRNKDLNEKLNHLQSKKKSSLKSEFEMLSIENEINVINKDIKKLTKINEDSCNSLEKTNDLMKHYVDQIRTILLELSSDI
jgi:hypothetical protein|tara:strand:- start:896 stop:1261 length:366 start_codon:yes stop_codon:yes gene_type:complete